MKVGEIPVKILKEFMKNPFEMLPENMEKFVPLGNKKDSLVNFQDPYKFFFIGKHSCIFIFNISK